MTWRKLVATNRAKPHKTSEQEIDSLRAVVERDLKDAAIPGLSEDRRFATAYHAVLQLATMATACAGYRVTARQGHAARAVVQARERVASIGGRGGAPLARVAKTVGAASMENRMRVLGFGATPGSQTFQPGRRPAGGAAASSPIMGKNESLAMNPSIRRALAVCIFWLTPVPAGVLCAADARPNIVVFLVDDMGLMDSSAPFLTDNAGRPKRYPLNDFYRTPNMERLAARGIRFNNYYAMSVCSPSRISLLTGQNAARHRTTNWIHPNRDNRGPSGPPAWNWKGPTRGDVTLPRLLQTAGYHTIHVGKGHFGPRDAEGAEPRNLGFDVNVAGCSIGQPGSHHGMHNYGHGRKHASHVVPDLAQYHGTETFLTEALTLEANARVTDAVKAGRPFFLYLSHYAVHAPFHSDPRFAAHYRHSGRSEPARAFATLIEGVDKSLGDVLDHLDALGVAENTVFFFLGDNGSDAPLGHPHEVACAAPLRGKKGTHYEGGMRVPFLAAWAKAGGGNPHQRRLPIAAGAIQSQQAAVQDLFPTLLGLAGVVSPPEHVVDGKRLDTLLAGRSDSAREEVFLMHYPHSPHRSDYFTVYREGPWKVVYHYFPSVVSENSHYQLYHLAEDPFEKRNLAGSRPDELGRMMRGLMASLEQHNALYPVDEDGATPLKPKLP